MDLNATSVDQPLSFTAFDGVLYFDFDDGIHGVELWKSDGTVDGTTLVKDILPDSVSDFSDGSEPYFLTVFDGKVYFSADDGIHGRELWRTDGTAEGTEMVRDIAVGSASSGLFELVSVAESLFFVADDGTHGYELWKSDGTPDGTVLVKDIDPEGSFDELCISCNRGPRNLTAVRDQLFFAASDGDEWQIWKSDGATEGTVTATAIEVHPYCEQSDYPAYNCDPFLAVTAVDSLLYFVVDDGVHGFEPWMTDGTVGGTRLVKNIYPGDCIPDFDCYPPTSEIAALGSLAMLASDDGYHGVELWRSDGTSEGTILIRHIEHEDPPYENSPAPRFVEDLFVAEEMLFFRGFDHLHGWELWKSDGTAQGTNLLRDIHPGIESSFGYFVDPEFTDVAGTLFFVADDGLHGLEIWLSDGTESGTRILEDIVPGTNRERRPFRLTGVDTKLFFAIGEDDLAKELWVVDGAASLGTSKQLPSPIHLTGPYPNPFQHRARITLAVRNPQTVFAALYDVLGRRVAVVFRGRVISSETLMIDGGLLPNGLYVLRIEGEDFAETAPILRVR